MKEPLLNGDGPYYLFESTSWRNILFVYTRMYGYNHMQGIHNVPFVNTFVALFIVIDIQVTQLKAGIYIDHTKWNAMYFKTRRSAATNRYITGIMFNHSVRGKYRLTGHSLKIMLCEATQWPKTHYFKECPVTRWFPHLQSANVRCALYLHTAVVVSISLHTDSEAWNLNFLTYNLF